MYTIQFCEIKTKKMRKIILLAVILTVGTSLFAQNKWIADKAHAKIGFTGTHMTISEVDGSFKKFDASFSSSKPDFTDAVFEVTVDVNSIGTDNEMRDSYLKGDRYFDVAKYPELSFKSKSISKVGDNIYKLTGNLTAHGVTKSVTFNMVVTGVGKDSKTQKSIVGLKITGTINRNDFGVGHVPAAMVGEDIEIRAVGEFDQQ